MYKRKLEESKDYNPKRLKPNDRDSIAEPEDSAPIKVFCRIRPVIDQLSDIYDITSSHSLKLKPPENSAGNSIEQFEFTEILGPKTSQEQVANTICYPLLDDLMSKSKCGLLFSYGITNAGKTHTIMGSYEAPGIIPRALQYLTEKRISFKIQFFEVYNDRIYDLLQVSNKKDQRESLKVRQDNASVKIIGISEKNVQSFTKGMEYLNFGVSNRMLGETSCNQASSRSHSIFVIILDGENAPKLAIVDLAGAERTLRANTNGERLKEAGFINNSLSVLGRCLEAIKNNQTRGRKEVVPFRDTLLTKIFSEFFANGENKNISLIININQAREDFDETLSVLKFGAITTGIKPMKSKYEQIRKAMSPDSNRLQELEEILKLKDDEIQELKKINLMQYEENQTAGKQREYNIEVEMRRKVTEEWKTVLTNHADMYKKNRDLILIEYDKIIRDKNEIWAKKFEIMSKKPDLKDSCTSPKMELVQEFKMPSICLNPFKTHEISIQTEIEDKTDREKLQKTQEEVDIDYNIRTIELEIENKPKLKIKRAKMKPVITSPVSRRTRKGAHSKISQK